VISYSFWQSYFGGDQKIIGKTVRINTKLFVVIGVMAADFVGLGFQKGGLMDAWLPLTMRSEIYPQDQNRVNRRNCDLTIAGDCRSDGCITA